MIKKIISGPVPPTQIDYLWLDTSEDIHILKSWTKGEWASVSTTRKDIYEEVSYETLISQYTNKKLIPGKYYRMTDFVTTVNEEGAHSAGHQFDLILLALSEDTFSEHAQAIQHEGDTYFAESNLAAWELKYCIENDTNRFSWADPDNGKGVIYYMKDEWNNECGYDFKNVIYEVRPEILAHIVAGPSYNTNLTRYPEQDINNLYAYKASKVSYGGPQYVWFETEDVTIASIPLKNDGTPIGCTIIYVETSNFDTYTFQYKRNNIEYDATVKGTGNESITVKNNFFSPQNGLSRNFIFYPSYPVLCYNNYIGEGIKNHFYSIRNTSIKSGSYNVVTAPLENTNIGYNFEQNSINGINSAIRNCIFGDSVKHNLITTYFHLSNVIIKNNFNNNILQGSLDNGRYSNGCLENTIIGGNVSNLFIEHLNIYDTEIKNGVSYLKITSTMPFNSRYMRNVTIERGICGTSSELKIISWYTETPIDNLPPTIYQPADTQVINI